jgi:hypothetical protein
MNQCRLQYIYTWKYHREIPYIAIVNKQKCLFFSFTKSENKRAEHVLPERLVPVGGGERVCEGEKDTGG